MRILFIVSFLIVQSCYTQEIYQPTKKQTFWTKVWGKSPENGIKFLPFATHFQKSENPFIHGTFYTAANYKSFEVAAFNNSYNDFSMSFFYLREVTLYKKLKLQYGGGFLYGYKGRLQKVKEIPFHDTFLYSGNLNPTYGIGLEYCLSKKWAISAMTNPAVIIYGLKYYW
ncbi:hypothetical protein [Wenyingzhuangia sp. IMCC45467]